MWPNPQIPADLITFTEEIYNGKLHFLLQWLDFRKLNFSVAVFKFIEFFRICFLDSPLDWEVCGNYFHGSCYKVKT